MSIASRVEDAEHLWAAGRREGALTIALIAFAATARRLHPKPASDRAAFEKLYQDSMTVHLEIAFRGKPWPVETILYKWLRCELVHEGGLPVDVEFTDDGDGPMPMIRAGGPPDYKLLLGNGWYDFLIKTVVAHPINADHFPWREDWLQTARAARTPHPPS
ncbi:hypothetical protein [Solwaraspora sp. WMMD792]|uniref:hypothetical protein n=1 Tax=Solwaraspora sp. WMMD792 TaxID=3016099 RepID=UPI0024168DCF|nr:hypothetical protein [Solwaraspora sp. WMMD792]MDG4773519.1 hypothetical protein [Solwaraspora sp. WMMD792]